jgi:hypothetical protein
VDIVDSQEERDIVMSERIVVAKFGGTSVASAAQLRKISSIIRSNPERRFIVVSAPGKRFPEDIKVTDLLLNCYEKASAGESFAEELNQVKLRFREIIEGLQMVFPLNDEIRILEQSLMTDPQRDYTASRGEYLTAKIMAQYLGFTFVDPSWCVCFDENGQLKAFVSCGERPRFEINPDDGELYQHKFHEGFDEHFRLGPEDESHDDDEVVDESGLVVTITPRWEEIDGKDHACADIIVKFNGEEVDVNDCIYEYYFDDVIVMRYNDVTDIEVGTHNFTVLVRYKGYTAMDSKDLIYEGES